MNISPFRKQIQKFFLFIVIILISFSIFPVLAQASSFNINMPESGTLAADEANCAVNKMAMTGKVEFNKAYANPNTLGLDDELKFFMELVPGGAEDVAANLRSKCASQINRLSARMEIVYLFEINSGVKTARIDSYKLKAKGNGFALNFPAFKLSQHNLNKGSNISFNFYVSFDGVFERKIIIDNFPTPYEAGAWKAVDGTTSSNEAITTGYETEKAGVVVAGGDDVRKLSDINVTFSGGLRDTYRVVLNDTDPKFKDMVFGSNGLPKVHLEWTNPQMGLVPGYLFEVPKKNWGFTVTGVRFQNLFTGFNFADQKKENLVCSPKWTDDDCSTVVFTKLANSEFGDVSGTAQSLPNDLDPKIYGKAWSSKVSSSATAAEGKPLGTVNFVVIPIIKGLVGATDVFADGYSAVLNSKAVGFKVEVYKSAADVKKACEADTSVTDKSICADPAKMRYEVGKVITASTGTDEAPLSAGKTLYDFIVSIILTIVVFLTSQIYEIFAFFVVPVLKALLKVRPYQDQFVNIIYPGWLILRNLANIFFIISLLVVGLRILFQQSAASTARGFIMRLIIMALLVNFSLVIGQGIVGIADTVQSQFLPAESKVIEALGTKLMVEPVQTFRSAVTGSETGEIKGDPNIGDVTKPLVMLILAVAAFFSFIAIAAFLAVRLVALMILYMVSPIAYVGFVMDETKSYAKRWWNEFLKYAFVTPILVFFLNIAALVAVSTASSTGNVFKIDEGIADAFVSGGLTIISHFIVLLIIFAGMKFALSSGHAGAGTIVKYAQKGFENTFRKPAQLAGKAAVPAKDFLGDKAAVGAGKLFGNRAENIVQSLFKPKDALGKLKKGAWDKPGEDRKKREAKRLQTIEDQSYKIMNNKWKATKYAASTLAGAGPKRAFAEGGALIDESQILTDEDRQKFVAKLDEQKDLQKQKIEEKELLDGGKMTVAKADSMTAGMDRDMLKLQNEQRELEKQRKKYAADNNQLGVDTADKDIQDVKDRLTAIQEAKKGIEDAKITATDGVFEFKNLQALEGFNVVFKPDEYKATLDKQAKDAETEKSRIERQLEEDDRRRKDYGYGGANEDGHKKMTEPVRVQLYEAGAKAQEAATKRFLPESLSSREARRAAEREEDKKVEDIDDPEELTENFASAMKKNNIALATAIAKKLAKEGNFDKLLAKQGYENNVESFQAFMDKNFKNMVPEIRFQIASEVSHLASQNGNTTFVKPTKVKDGVMRWSRIEEHQEARNPKIKNASSADLAKKKKWEIFTQRNGQEELASATLQAFNNMDKKKLQEYVKRKSPEELATIAKAANYKDLNPNVRREFENRVI